MTTTLGIRTKEGIVLAADRRVSGGVSFIASKQGKKIYQIDNRIGVSIAGMVSDAQDIIDRIKAELRLYNYSRGYEMRVDAAAQFIGKIFHSYYKSGAPILAELLIAGTDGEKFYLYLMDPSGALIPDDRFMSTGSGSELSYGVLEGSFRDNINLDEAKKLAIKAMSSAIERNPHTGNGIDMAIITNTGFQQLTDGQISKIIGGNN